MTIQEAGKNYDVSMNYWYDEEADLWGWALDIKLWISMLG